MLYIIIIIIEEGVATNSERYINVNFTTGSINASFDIVTASNNVLEGDQRINISIFSITNGHIVGTPSAATVTIIDTTGMYDYVIILNCSVVLFAIKIICLIIRTCIITSVHLGKWNSKTFICWNVVRTYTCLHYNTYVMVILLLCL